MILKGGELPLCAACIASFRQSEGVACPRCATPLARPASNQEDCPRCHDRGYCFQAALALGVYRGNLREAVLRMKQVFHEPLTLAMGGLLGEHLCQQLSPPWPELIVPVPMHWTRRMVRGTNTAEVLVEAMVRRLHLPVALELLQFRRKVKKQGTLTPWERFRNVQGAFSVSSDYAIKDTHILLVDDVMTTGATASEAAKVLRRRGAAKVTVGVIARGIGH